MQKRQIHIFLLALIFSLVAYAGSVLLLPAREVLAQSFVIGSDPVDGSTINAAPSVVRIYFNAAVSKISSVHVYAVGSGQLVEVNAAPSYVSPTNPDELDTPLKPASTLPEGSYEVKWTAVSDNDGRVTFGLIGFNVGYSSTGLPGVPVLGPSTSNDLSGMRAFSSLNILSILWEWLALIALVLWLGTLSVEWLLARSPRTQYLLERTQKQAQSLQWFCLAGLLVADCVNLALRSIHIDQITQQTLDLNTLPQLLLETSYGWLWMAHVVILLVAMLLLALQRRNQPSEPAPEPVQRKNVANNGPLRQYVTGELRAVTTASLPREHITTSLTKERMKEISPTHARFYRYTWFSLPPAVLYLLTHAITGESTQVLHPHISAIIFDALNLWAQGLWFGGLAYLAYVLLPFPPALERDRHADMLVALLEIVTPTVLVAIGTTLVCSWFLGETSITSVQQLLTDPYGRTLLVQGALLIVLLMLGLYTFLVRGPRLARAARLLAVVKSDLPARRTRQEALQRDRRHFALFAGIQAWGGAGILLCASLMMFFAPPIVFPAVNYNTNTQQPAAPTTTTTTQTRQIGNLSVTLQVVPGKIAANNTVLLTLVGPGGQLVTNAHVQLRVNMQAMDMGTAQATATGGNPMYVATFRQGQAFSMAGLWVINVRISQPGQLPVSGTFTVNV
jgi:putative copper export protein/methionine-rich copper-binding protein CopC